MKNKIYFSFFCLLVLGCGAFLFFSRPTHPPEKAFACFARGEYAAAEEALEKVDSENLYFPVSLYQGYLAQANGQFRKSDYFLQNVLKEAPRKNQKELLFETFLAHIINAYHEKRDTEIFSLLESAKQFSTSGTSLLFFEGLGFYLQNRYGDALRFWSAYQPQKQSWLSLAIERGFPLTWRQLHRAHCLTEEGDIVAGREILEQQQHQLDLQNSDYQRLATLFLGLTYLKEAEALPLHERGSYYKLAHFYFARSEKIEPFFREKNCIIAHLQEELLSLLVDCHNEEARAWSFSFLHILQDWKAESALNVICKHTIHLLLQSDSAQAHAFCKAVLQEFNGALFHTLLTQQLHHAMAQNLKSGRMDHLFALWQLAQGLFTSPQTIAREIATLTQEEMFKTIYQDDESLTRTRRYLAFWSHLSQDRKSCHRMAHDLFLQSVLFWNQGGQEPKGHALMALALNLSPDKKAVEREIETFLSALYSQAENSNMIYRLSLIHDALLSFNVGVKKKDLVDSSKLANHLADAEYLYDARNYAAAKMHASWVLKLDPANPKALRLLGLASFQLGEYTSALFYLQKLSEPDALTQKAIAFSQAFASQQQKEHIAQIDNTDSFTEE